MESFNQQIAIALTVLVMSGIAAAWWKDGERFRGLSTALLIATSSVLTLFQVFSYGVTVGGYATERAYMQKLAEVQSGMEDARRSATLDQVRTRTDQAIKLASGTAALDKDKIGVPQWLWTCAILIWLEVLSLGTANALRRQVAKPTTDTGS